jgi:predicted Zn finger-like uncharacterized protein
MIVTCPACASRYRFDEGRLGGRSAKITCPSCAHVFVATPPRGDASITPDTWPSEAPIEPAEPLAELDVDHADFSAYDVEWQVRQGLGLMHRFNTLAALQEALDDGIVSPRDDLSYDGRHFVRIDGIDDLREHFRDVLERAQRGEVKTDSAFKHVIGRDVDDDEADAPTTIVRTGNAFALDLEAGLDEEIGHAPPPPVDTAAPEEGEAPTEDVSLPPTAPALSMGPPPLLLSPNASLGAQTAAPAPQRPAAGAASRLPILGLVAVVIGVLVLILWRQGVFGG